VEIAELIGTVGVEDAIFAEILLVQHKQQDVKQINVHTGDDE
jgi:hypothetical protein